MRIGLALFPGLCQLDMTGPHEVLVRLPGAQVEVVAKTSAPVATDRGLTITPDVALADAPQYDVFVMPGGPGQQDLMEDVDWLGFLRTQAESARVMMGVCTGSLVMGAAGLLRGYKATTHWSCHDLLALLGAAPEIVPRLRAFVRVGERRWDIVLDRDMLIKLPETGGVEALSRIMALHYGEELLDRDIAVIDMRLPDRPALRMRPEAAETFQIRKAVAALGGEDT